LAAGEPTVGKFLSLAMNEIFTGIRAGAKKTCILSESLRAHGLLPGRP
jgi:hypothetical protein